MYALGELTGQPPGMPDEEYEARQALLELIDRLVWGEEPHPELYDLLVAVLGGLLGLAQYASPLVRRVCCPTPAPTGVARLPTARCGATPSSALTTAGSSTAAAVA